MLWEIAANQGFLSTVRGALAGRAIGLTRRYAQRGLDGRPETLVTHSLRQLSRLPEIGRREGLVLSSFLRRRGLFFLPLGPLDDETEALDRVARRDFVHAPQELAAQVGELVGPHGRRTLHGEDAAPEVTGARAARDLVAGGARPRGVGARLLARREPVE